MPKAKAPARTPTKKPTSKAHAKGTSARKAAGKPAASRTKADTRPDGLRSHTPTPGLEGWLTHTEFACTDPVALKRWAEKVLGWSFGAPFKMPGEDYHLFAYGKTGGGGIMRTRDGESPRVTPYAHVASVTKTLEKALKAGAKHIMGPDTVMPGVTLAIVEAPGGIMMGFSGGR
jgi:predicted enzyme related to lactoylglutathione lyase